MLPVPGKLLKQGVREGCDLRFLEETAPTPEPEIH